MPLDGTLPATLPPGEYSVEVLLFDDVGPLPRALSGASHSFNVTSLTVLPAAEYPRLEEVIEPPVAPLLEVGGLKLMRAEVASDLVRPGQSFLVTLTWLADRTIVLDPFCGCATACVAADQLGRKWVGIDMSPKAVRGRSSGRDRSGGPIE